MDPALLHFGTDTVYDKYDIMHFGLCKETQKEDN